ncbi:MAG: hypothetical protein QNJ97_28560 [Myxococcota bacterium]|nr:hypothetical protein [Myxococcota bacterium]
MTHSREENSRECSEMRANHKMARGMDRRIRSAERRISTREDTPYDPSPEEVVNIVDFIHDVVERSIAYSWAPITRALVEGRPVRLTRRGMRIYLQHRNKHRTPIDYRAVEIEAMKNKELFSRQTEPDNKPEKQGYTIAEFAKILGVDRGALAKNLVEIPTGPAPSLPDGKIPCRKIGKTKRIFMEDLFGHPDQDNRGNANGHHFKEETTGSTDQGDWRGSLNRLRLAGPKRG